MRITSGLDRQTRSCTIKDRHKRQEALRIAARQTKIHKVKYEAYRCQYCGAWHVGRGKDEVLIPERLKTCLAAGGSVSLFSILCHWDREELKALLTDVEIFYDQVDKQVTEAHIRLIFTPANFLSAQRSQAFDAQRTEARLQLLSMCSEISSVALYYLETT